MKTSTAVQPAAGRARPGMFAPVPALGSNR